MRILIGAVAGAALVLSTVAAAYGDWGPATWYAVMACVNLILLTAEEKR